MSLVPCTRGVFSSAGVTTGIDLCLAIIRQDVGAKAALSVARELVVHLHRPGGQSQFSELLNTQFSASPSIQCLIDRLLRTPEKQWTLQSMADSAAMTPRTLCRKFSAEVNDSPVHFLEKIRVKNACDAISAGFPVSKIISDVGFGDFQKMQRAFKRNLDMTIGDYRKLFS